MGKSDTCDESTDANPKIVNNYFDKLKQQTWNRNTLLKFI